MNSQHQPDPSGQPDTSAFIWALERIGERRTYGPPPVGRLIAYRDRVWRVVETLPGQVLLRAEGGDALTPRDGDGQADLHDIDDNQWWRVLPEHHAVCAHCGEPMPCRRLRELGRANAELKHARRLMAIPAGACWACEKPITTRQKTITFPGDNLRLPGGPPVTFHAGIQECRLEALRYQDEEWVKAEPSREPFLTWHEPYTGTPNTPQRRILAMAARGELRCYLQRVMVAAAGDNLADMMTNPDHPKARHRWMPCTLRRGADKHVFPLVAAGLLAEPIPEHLGYHEAPYTLTDEGRATHRRYPEPADRAGGQQ